MRKILILFFLFCGLVSITAQDIVIERPPRILPQAVKKALLIKDDGLPLEVPVFKDGKAKLKGCLLGYKPEMGYMVSVYAGNPITGIQDSHDLILKDNGEFEAEIPLTNTMQVLLRISYDGNHIFYNDYMLLSPDEETIVYVDLQQKACQEAQNPIDKCEEDQYMFFTGANAEINNQMNRANVLNFFKSFSDYDQMMKDIVGMSAIQYKDYRMNKMNEAILTIPQLSLTRKASEFLKLAVQYENIYELMFGASNLREAYRRANNLGYDDKMEGFEKPVTDAAYYSFLADSPINNPISLSVNAFGNMINSCKYVRLEGAGIEINFGMLSENVLQAITKSENLTKEEELTVDYLRSEIFENWTNERVQLARTNVRNVVQKIIDMGKLDPAKTERANKIKEMSSDNNVSIRDLTMANIRLLLDLHHDDVMSLDEIGVLQDANDQLKQDSIQVMNGLLFKQKYIDLIIAVQDDERRGEQRRYLASILGTDTGILYDLMQTQQCTSKFEKLTPLNDFDFKKISKLDNPFYLKYLTKKNTELLAQIEANKNKKGYNVYDIPDTEGDKILYEIVKPFAGKVIFIDFWATWCGPCRSAMKQFEPTKETFKGKDVAFLYLTDESSPMETWNNMIPTINGEHIRLKDSQMNYLKRKFGIKGIPAYLILDKKGEQVYFMIGFEGASTISKILNDQLVKN